MSEKGPKSNPPFKKGLHPRNLHRSGYNFEELIAGTPELAPFVAKNRYGNLSVNFADPAAVRMLNRALLRHFYGVTWWEIPENYLCPPIPGRADYIHYIADLLGTCNGGNIPKGPSVRALDIGVGANCIYPLIGTHEYGWHFTGSDIDPTAIASARKIVDANPSRAGLIDIRLQSKLGDIFKGIMRGDEVYDITLCNPPFHASEENAQAANERKRTNLNTESGSKLNFGGQSNELWTKGGEASFVRRMIDESSRLSQRCLWFSTLVSKKNTMEGVYKTLKRVKAAAVRTINMEQGQKTSRVIAWSFLDAEARQHWGAGRWQGGKTAL